MHSNVITTVIPVPPFFFLASVSVAILLPVRGIQAICSWLPDLSFWAVVSYLFLVARPFAVIYSFLYYFSIPPHGQ